MSIKRRDFIKGCAAAGVLLLPGIAAATKGTNAGADANANNAAASAAEQHIQKSIKASFGGGFSVRTHSQSNGLTCAEIEHLRTRYSVASADLLDWQIVGVL